MLDRADYADFGCHNSIRLEAEHFRNTIALTIISFSRRFVFAVQKHSFFFASDPPVTIAITLNLNPGILLKNKKTKDNFGVPNHRKTTQPLDI